MSKNKLTKAEQIIVTRIVTENIQKKDSLLRRAWDLYTSGEFSADSCREVLDILRKEKIRQIKQSLTEKNFLKENKDGQ